ncbi:MAG: DUF1289 domain-containing protein [Bacteroidetes bacterium]|nr:DUF1289 domain-containing protein [Bacteroidota bacterium]
MCYNACDINQSIVCCLCGRTSKHIIEWHTWNSPNQLSFISFTGLRTPNES